MLVFIVKYRRARLDSPWKARERSESRAHWNGALRRRETRTRVMEDLGALCRGGG